LAIDNGFAAFLEEALRKLDAELNLDFNLVSTDLEADVRFYSDADIDLASGNGVTMGIALMNDTDQGDFWELILDASVFGGDLDYLYYVALHELAHALGLEHPFDASDGDVFKSSRSGRSAYPIETVMASRNPRGDNWPTWFTPNDLAALKAIWGEETEAVPTLLSQKMIGNSIDDTLIGGSGPDLLRGELGNDRLTGGGGVDELWGGPGMNQFFSAADGAVDWLLISSDGSSNTRSSGTSVDEIADLGSEDQVGILGASTPRLRFSPASIDINADSQLVGIGIYVGNRLEAIYTGGDLTRTELQNLTVGLPASYSGALG
jgi:hypothetical protein